MTGFLSELGKKLAERWLTLVLLPGLLFLAALGCAVTLGNAHAVDSERLASRLTAVTKDLSGQNSKIGMVVIGVLLGSLAAGLLARGVAALVLDLWLGQWRWPLRGLARLLRARRHARAEAAAAAAGVRPVPAYLPDRPTWIGDRLRNIGARVNAEYGVDIDLVWPRLWLGSGESLRGSVSAARGRFDLAGLLTAWGCLYLVMGFLWWPAAIGGIITVLTGCRRGRTACEEFAVAVESAVDLRLRWLAKSLGLALSTERVTPAEGAVINSLLGKGA